MTKEIRVGKVKIGGGAPVSIQSMAKTDTKDIAATIKEIRDLERRGCELVRVAVKDLEAAGAIKKIKKRIRIPLVADIHFDYRLAIIAIENGADKIRLNPGNIYREPEVIEVARLAKKMKVPIRVGVNSGSLRRVPYPLPIEERKKAKEANLANLMVKGAMGYIKILERARFYDIIVSLKSSDVFTTIEAYRKFSRRSSYPLHLGITAAGPISTGLIKSSMGIGALLSEGIGDTIRVSLTGPSYEEVTAAKNILHSLNLRRFGPEIISCPTCGRCQVDLQKVVRQIESRITNYASRFTFQEPRFTKSQSFKVAIMGCEVNGPGEAREADIGIAFGRGAGILFKKGKIIRRVKANDAVSAILNEIRNTKYAIR